MRLGTQLEIEPYAGVAGIQFGMTPVQVRSVLGGMVRSLRKSPADELETDIFEDLGIQVFYRQPGVCEAIELAIPAKPVLQGRMLIGKPLKELQSWLQSIDPKIEIDETGLTSFQLGIGLYAPFSQELPDDPVEGVIVFARGYYDS